MAEAGWESQAFRRAHNPEVGGSNPPPAIILKHGNTQRAFEG